MSEKKTKPELLYITNPNCGWCKKADPVVKTLIEEGYKIVTLDMSKPEEAKKANTVIKDLLAQTDLVKNSLADPKASEARINEKVDSFFNSIESATK